MVPVSLRLFKALMGFVHLAQGDITILQQSVNKALKKNLIAYVPQSEEVDWSFPVLVEDVVMMGRYGHMGWLRRPTAHDHACVDAALARVDMQEYRHRQIWRAVRRAEKTCVSCQGHRSGWTGNPAG
ncbi:iron transport ATP-binding protein [Salmonella enterica subsp. enterica serovar Daytona]|uniref:Iron transport ATP-binding protein n=1 Tax=Salmonella enterica subsp. enterica serovar Daytona TaxID=1962639 RepID=A0A447JDF2_SALET|nr:iron transport ATP-binding protein [Salmonella enterica subsp. enterica serovar Daytona]